VIAGSVLLGSAYLGSALSVPLAAAGEGGRDEDIEPYAPLFVPIAGPFITIGTAESDGAGTLWLAIDGLAQTAGVVMLIGGLASERSYLQLVDPTPYTSGAMRPPKKRQLGYNGHHLEPGYHVETKAHRPLMLAGGITFASTYGLSALVGATGLATGDKDAEELWPMLLPVAGPFITLGTSDIGTKDNEGFIAMMIFDSLAQGTGLGLLIAGATMTREVQVIDPVKPRPSAWKPELLVGPTRAAARWRY
jgi:hypothetical protein